MASTTPKEKQPVSLRVMRLSKPFFSVEGNNYYEPTNGIITKALDQVSSKTLSFNDSQPLPPMTTMSSLLSPTPESSTYPPALSTSSSLNDLVSSVDASYPPPRMRDYSDSEILKLPPNFGMIYLGETFTTYICLNNETNQVVNAVSMKIELQTSSQKLLLVESKPTPLNVRKNIEYISQYEIKELGVHILICTVLYMTPTNEQRTIKRFYKFQVHNPIAVKTKVNSLSDGRIFFEAQIQNTSQEKMFLEKVEFDAHSSYHCKELNSIVNNTLPYTHYTNESGHLHLNQEDSGQENQNTMNFNPNHHSHGNIPLENTNKPTTLIKLPSDEEVTPLPPPSASASASPPPTATAHESNGKVKADGEEKEEDSPKTLLKPKKSVFGSSHILLSNNVRQYLFMLEQIPGISPLNILGKLDIQWRTSFGEVGRLQTSPLSRKIPPVEYLNFQVIAIEPEMVKVEQPFQCSIRLTNNSPSDMTIQFSCNKDRMGHILCQGKSYQTVRLESQHAQVLKIQCLPMVCGLHALGGFKLFDIPSGLTKEIDHLTDIYVYDDNDDDEEEEEEEEEKEEEKKEKEREE